MLKKFKEKKKRRKQIITFTILCVFLIVGIFLYSSFALFETNEQFNMVSGTVENPGDISFTFYINDEIVLEVPKQDSGLALDEKSSCTNGVSVSWNVETWNAKLDYSSYKQENTSNVKCNLYFRDALFSDYVTSCGQNNTSATECMKKYARVDTANLAYDETTDNNLRYIGADPNNYVWFNEELWRIIGVMNNIESESTEKETRLKIIRDESIGNYSWDTSASNINVGCGINEWSQSKLMNLLNDYYFNRKDNQICYNDLFNATVSCDFSKIGLKETSKKYFTRIKWNTGAYNIHIFNGNLQEFYVAERGTTTGKICSNSSYCTDSLERTVTWLGNIAVAYISDYGYATSGGTIKSRKNCVEEFSAWKNSDFAECKQNNWLNRKQRWWTLTISAHNSGSDTVFTITESGDVGGYYGADGKAIYPTLYLDDNVTIISGIGTRERPYLLK